MTEELTPCCNVPAKGGVADDGGYDCPRCRKSGSISTPRPGPTLTDYLADLDARVARLEQQEAPTTATTLADVIAELDLERSRARLASLAEQNDRLTAQNAALVEQLREMSEPRQSENPVNPAGLVFLSPNPMPSDIDWARVGSVLGVTILPGLSGKVALPVGIGEGESDFLGTERQEVNGLGEGANVRVGVALEGDDLLGGDPALLDAFEDEASAGQRLHGSSPSVESPDSATANPFHAESPLDQLRLMNERLGEIAEAVSAGGTRLAKVMNAAAKKSKR